MYNASNHAGGAVLSQRQTKVFYTIYYASRTLNKAQLNYAIVEKELPAIVFAFNKFRPYLIGNKLIIFMDHLMIKYLIAKKDANSRLILVGSFPCKNLMLTLEIKKHEKFGGRSSL